MYNQIFINVGQGFSPEDYSSCHAIANYDTASLGQDINLWVYFLVGAGRADAEQLAIGFFGKHDPGRRVEQGESHGDTVAVRAGVGIPVYAFQKYHFS